MATILEVGAGKTYENINAAVTAAKSIEGKVEIVIADGTYTENVLYGSRTFVEDGVTYVGGITFKAAEGAEVNINGYFQCNGTAGDLKDIVFDGLTITNTVRNGGYFAPIMFGDNYTGKTASGIAVTNCVLNSSTGTATGTSSGVALTMSLSCDGVTVAGNTINADCGVYGGDGNLIANTEISGNTMNGNTEVPSYSYWGMVYIYNSGTGNVISGNTMDSSALCAVRIRKGAGVVVKDNTVTDCNNYNDGGVIQLTNGSVSGDNTVDGEVLTYPLYEGNDLLAVAGIAGAEGEAVIIDGIAYTVGTNVFADVSEAMKVVENNGIIKIAGTANLTGESGVIAPWGEGSDAGVVALYELDGKTVTWTADSEAVIDVAVHHIVLHGEGTLNISKNVVLDYQQAPAGGVGESLFVIGSFWAGDDATEKVTVNLDGKIVVGDVDLSGDNGSVKVRHNGVLNVSKTASIDADYSIRVRGGVLNVVGTGKDAEVAQLKSQRLEINGAGIEGGAASVVNIKDSYVSITYGNGDIADSFDMQNNRDYGYAKEFNFENSRVETGTLQLGDSVTVFKGKDSDFTINKNVTNAATINLEGSTFDVAGTVTNSGSINVAGKKTSKLDFTFADASTNKLVNVHGGGLEDSSFNGNMLVTGDAAVVGENTVDGIAKVVNGATLTVADEATLTVNKIALGEDNYGTLDVGEADEYAQKGGKLEVEGTLWGTGENGWGLNINVDANASMEIKDGAYVKASQIAVEDGGIEMTLADKAGYLKIADGSTLAVKYLKAFGRGEIDIEGDVYLNNDSHNETNFSLQVGHATLGNGTVNINSTGSVTGNGYNAKVFNGSELNIKGGSLNLYQHTDGRSGILQNDGIIDVSGASTINVAKVQGDGWIYMNGASVGADTNLVGANVRFASGSNVVDGSTITNGRFQVGTGTYQAPDSKVDTVNGVTVTVKNNAHIDTIDGSASPFGAWVGSEYYDKQADKDAAMTDAKYTLNIQNSIAEFGYLHISHDGFLNVTGDADELHNINATDYSFRSGQLNVNGVATFDNVTAMAFNANISCDNATQTPGKLVVTNGATFYAKHEDSGLTTSFEIWNNGIVEISNKATFFIGEHDAVLNIKTADGELIVNDAILNAGDITNNGTITVEGGANVTAGTILNAGTITVDGRSSITADDITTEGTITIDGAGFAGGTKTIIDLAAGIDLTGKVNLENGDGLTMIVDKENGDVYLTDVNMATICVNAEYAALEYGAAIPGKVQTYVGINAFGSFEDALAAVTATTGKIEISGTIAEDGPAESMEVALSGNLEIICTGEDAADIDWSTNKKIAFVRAEGVEGDIKLSFSNIDWSVGSNGQIYFGDVEAGTAINVEMDADCKVEAYLVRVGTGSTLDMARGAQMSVVKEVLRIEGTLNAAGAEDFDAATATVENRQIKAAYARVIDDGVLNLTNTYMSSYSQFIAHGDVNMDNARMDIGLKVDGTWGTNPASNATGWATFKAGANVSVDNNSLLMIGGANTSYGLTMEEGASFAIKNGSEVELSFGIDNSGTITVEGATLKVGTNFNPAITGTKHKFDLLNNGSVIVTGDKTSTLEIDTLTGNAIEVTGGGLKDSTVGGNILVTGDAAFEGDNAFGNVKVTNGAELIINGTLTGAGTYIGVGDDAVEGYYGIANGETAGGSVIINGNVDVVQVNANGGGYVEVAEKATLTTQIICVENGSLADAEAGSMEINGTVETQRFNVFGGATATVNGYVSSEQAYTSSDIYNVISVMDGGTLNINGEVVAGTIEHTQGRHSGMSVGENSTVNVNSGSLTVGGTLTNDGTVTVTGSSVVNIAVVAGKKAYVRFENASIYEDSTVGGNIRAYNKFDVYGNFTVKQSNLYGTTVIHKDAVYTGSTTIVGGEMTLENGATLNSRFLNVVGGTADIFGAVALEHSDPRQKLLQIHEDGVLNLNADGSITITRHNAWVKAGGTLNVNGGSLVATPDMNNVAPNRGGVLYNDGGTVNVNSGTVELKNWNNSIYVDEESGATSVASSVISGGNVTVSDTFTNDGELSVKVGATLTAGTISNAGTITIDATSKIIAQTLTMGDTGSIVIDVADLVGVWKVIDLNGNSSMEGNEKITFINNEGENFVVHYLNDGDIVIGNVNPATIYVNEDWADEEYMADLGDGKYFGFNAFADIDDAVAAAGDRTGVITVQNGDAVHVDLTTANPDGLTINMGFYGISFDENGNVISLETGEILDPYSTEGSEIYSKYIGENVTVNADILWQDFDAVDIDGVVNVTTVMKNNNGVMTINGNLNVSDRFVFAGDDAIIEVAADGNFNAKYLNSYNWNVDAEINVAGAAEFDEIDFGGTVNIADGGEFAVTDSMKLNKLVNNGTYKFATPEAVIDEVTNNGSFSVIGGVAAIGELVNNSEMSATAGNLEIDTLNNDGTLTAGGNSVLTIGSLVNDGEIVLTENTSVTLQSVINNNTVTLDDFNGTLSGYLKGDGFATGNIKVLGDSTLADTVDTSLLSIGSWDDEDDAEIAAGDKLTVAAKGVVNTSDLYVQGGGELDVVGQVNVIGHYNNISGIYVNYGVTNVSGTMSVTNDASCGENQIGNVKFDNSKIKLNILDGGVFNLNTTIGITAEESAAKLNIVAGAELNINEGGTFNSDKVSVVVNNGTVNVDGTANINGSMTNDGAVVVDGTANVKTLTNNGAVTVNVNGVYNGNNLFTNGGSLTVDGGEFDVRDLVNGSVNPGTIELKNEAELNVVGTLSNSYNGTITIEAGSLITVDKFVNNGIIDISVKGDGVWLVIDGKEGMSNFGKVTVNGVVQDGLMYTDEDNGDLYLVNTRSDALYFNSEWDANLAASLGANTFKDTVIGDTAVEIKDGVNAIKFYNGSYSDYTVSVSKDVAIATLEDAIKLNLTAEGALTVETGTRFELDADSTLTITENGSVTIEAGDKDKAIAAAELNAGNIVNAGSVTVNGVMSGNVDNSGSVTVNGSATGNMTNSGTLILNSEESIFADFSNSGTVEIGENGKFTATDDFVSEGKFVVNVAEDMAGAKLVIDLAEGGAYRWNADDIEFNVADGMNAFYDADGDVAVSNASMATYEFNKAWAESELADLVDGEAGKSGFYYDINAFDDTAALTGQQKDADGKLLAEKLAFYAGEYDDLALEQDMILEFKADGVAQMNLTSTNVVSVNTKFNMAGSLALNGETAALNVAEKATATFDKIVLDDAATAVSNINGNLNVANDMQVRNMNIAATAAVVAKSVSVLENTGVNVKGSLSIEDMQIADNATVNVSGVHGKLTIDKTSETKAKATIAADATLNITDSAVFTCTGVVDNNGCINVSNASVAGKGKINNTGSGVITISGVSTFDTTITGSGAIRLLNNATIAGTLTVGGEVDANGKKIDTMLFVERNGYLAANANFTGKLNGMYMYIGGSGNTIKLDDESTITLMVADKTVFGEDDDLASVVIKGNGKNVVLTAADSALNGNKLENLKLNITAADGWVAADIALENILSINGKELVNDNGIFYYEDDNGIRKFVTRVEDEGKYGINITSGTATIYEVGNITIKEGSDKLANVNVVMKEGKTSFTVKNGKKGVLMEFAVGSILKSELGGSNKVAFGNYNDVEVNGAIESINSLSIGNNSFVDIDGNITGQNTNDTVKIGADSEVEIGGYVDLEGGKNKFSVGARSEVTVAGSISGIADLNVASGKKAKKDGSGADWTDVTINGNYVAAEMNNKLTVGNYVNFTLGSVNGVSIDNGGVASATGTTVKVGTESVVKIAGSANGIAGVTTGKQSYVVFGTETVDNAGKVTDFAGADIEGSDKNNKLSTGAESTFKARDIDLCGGKNSIVTGKMSDFVAGNIDNVQTVTVGSQSSFKVGAIDNVNKFTVNKGKAASKKAGAVLTDVVVNGNVTMTTGKDSFTVGNDSNVLVSGNISFGDGKDTLSLGKNSKLAVNDITGMEVFKASAGATLIVWNGKGNDVNFDSVTGSWNKATIIDYEGDIELNDTGYGYVYANEKDCYDLEIADGVKLTDFSDDMEVTYAVLEDGVWSEFKTYTEGMELAAGTYRFEVGVAGEYEKLEKKTYSFTVAELA